MKRFITIFLVTNLALASVCFADKILILECEGEKKEYGSVGFVTETLNIKIFKDADQYTTDLKESFVQGQEVSSEMGIIPIEPHTQEVKDLETQAAPTLVLEKDEQKLGEMWEKQNSGNLEDPVLFADLQLNWLLRNYVDFENRDNQDGFEEKLKKQFDHEKRKAKTVDMYFITIGKNSEFSLLDRNNEKVPFMVYRDAAGKSVFSGISQKGFDVMRCDVKFDRAAPKSRIGSFFQSLLEAFRQ